MNKTILITSLFLSSLIGDSYPEPPEIPSLQAWADHESVYLYWDKITENSKKRAFCKENKYLKKILYFPAQSCKKPT